MTRRPSAFLAYCHADNQQDDEFVSTLREKLRGEVRTLTGEETFDIFMDNAGIAWGQDWRERLKNELDSAVFLVPVVTPSFLRSPECRKEVLAFTEIERVRKRNDLILPLLYIDTQSITMASRDGVSEEELQVAQAVKDHQWKDWRELRHELFTSPALRRAITGVAKELKLAFERVSPAAIQSNSAPPTDANWVFDSNSEAFHSDLSVVLSKCRAGDKVVVKPGTHRVESLAISVPIELCGSGDRDKCILELNDAATLTWKANAGRIHGLTIRKKSGTAPVVELMSPKCVINECVIEGSSGACIRLEDQATGSIKRCVLRGGEYGVSAPHRASFDIEDCEIVSNRAAGIASWLSASLRLRKNRITGNGHGLWVSRDTEVTLEQNFFSRNLRGPVNAPAGVLISLDGNEVEG